PDVRENVVRLAEARLPRSPELLDRVLALANDPAVRVRFQVAFTLGEVHDSRTATALTAIAKRAAADPWVRAAVLSSAAESCDRMLVEILKDERFSGDEAGAELTRQLAAVVGARNRPAEVGRVLAAVAQTPSSVVGRSLRQRIVAGLGEGLKR